MDSVSEAEVEAALQAYLAVLFYGEAEFSVEGVTKEARGAMRAALEAAARARAQDRDATI
jgi:hypothetical protein